MILFIAGVVLGIIIGILIPKTNKNTKKKYDIEIIGYIDGFATLLYEFDNNLDKYHSTDALKRYIKGNFIKVQAEKNINVETYDKIIAACDNGYLVLHEKE